ncbi:LADA_0G15434g1_1 [Lachancea dasiensis]|uniref:LADA_0G15434g1_1 n=1 Tax=Lachancea dasiensis TaxID=1072105 RepID=A0A1G4JWF1_9SACH|nr:LADA_0G15434g1_1 [Lachancea dasiensis]
MDPYALKRDNRKKFQDKEKLKRRHATPSDRKYRSLNKTAEPEPEKPELQANHYRYHEDISMTYQDNDFNTTSANRKLKDVLKGRKDLDLSIPRTAEVTRKDLDSMDVTQLNQLLGRKNNRTEENRESNGPQILEKTADQRARRPDPNATVNVSPNQHSSLSVHTDIPDELQSEQDLLDELI